MCTNGPLERRQRHRSRWVVVRQPSWTKECSKPRAYNKCKAQHRRSGRQCCSQQWQQECNMATWEGTFLNGGYHIYLVAERSKKKTFVRSFESLKEDCIPSLLPLHCPQVAATQTSAVGVRWKLQLPSRGIETTVTAGSLQNDLLTKPARALTVLGALQNQEEGQKRLSRCQHG